MLFVGTPRYAGVDVSACIAAVASVVSKMARRSASTQPQIHMLKLLRALLLDASVRRASGKSCDAVAPAASLKEQLDSNKVCDWALVLLNSTIHTKSDRPSLYADTVVPMLRNIAFKGREDDMLNLIAALEAGAGFLQPEECAREALRDVERKSKAHSALDAFEARTLWPRVREALEGVLLANHALDYGSTIFVVSSCFALYYCLWSETKHALLKRVGAVAE